MRVVSGKLLCIQIPLNLLPCQHAGLMKRMGLKITYSFTKKFNGKPTKFDCYRNHMVYNTTREM
jgi:hypothetical protein